MWFNCLLCPETTDQPNGLYCALCLLEVHADELNRRAKAAEYRDAKSFTFAPNHDYRELIEQLRQYEMSVNQTFTTGFVIRSPPTTHTPVKLYENK